MLPHGTPLSDNAVPFIWLDGGGDVAEFRGSSVERVTNDLSKDLESVVGFVRQAITSSKTILTPYDDCRPDSYAMAGLAHCCVLLEELENLRVEGNDLVAVLIGRACLETWLTATYSWLGREAALDGIAGTYVKNLRTMDSNLKESIVNAKARFKEATERRDHIIETNKQIAKHNPSKELIEVPPLPVPVMEVDVDSRPLIAMAGNPPEADVSLIEMAQKIGPLAEEKGAGGGNWETVYHFLYRALSTWGAHPTYWLLNAYLGQDTWLVHVKDRPDSDGRSHTVTRAMIELTAMLAAEIFEEFGLEVSALREIVRRYRLETQTLKQLGFK